MFPRLREDHAAQEEAVTAQADDQRTWIMQLEKEMNDLQAELAAQKEADTNTKSLVEDQKKQLAAKERRIKVAFFCRLSEPFLLFQLRPTTDVVLSFLLLLSVCKFTVSGSDCVLRVSARLCRSWRLS